MAGSDRSPDDVSVARTTATDWQADRDRLELEILRESLRHRSNGAKISILGMLIAIVPFFLVLRQQVPALNLGIWFLPMLVWLCWRAWIGIAVRRALDQGDDRRLHSFDTKFRLSSIGMQFWVGTGMWSVAGRGTEVDLYVTLAVCIFGTGAAISLVHDFRTVSISIPLLFGQCILFWLLKGADGYHISVPLIPVMILIIASARSSEKNLNESIAVRFENDALLRQLKAEKESAVSAARRAEEANRSKSMFMAAASHDLRQPLYAITLLSETLLLHDLPEPAKAIVDQQGRSLEALRHMFDNLLDLSRFDSGDVQPTIEAVFLPDVLGELLAEFHPLFDSKNLGFEVAGVDEFVWSDFDLLSRLLRNLISNAVRYTDEGQVEVKASRDGEFVTIEIIDSGCGIEPADQKRVFQEFVQLNNPERSREKGVGLGLSIVQRITYLLGHEVSLSSAPNRGTTVRVKLRRANEQSKRRAVSARAALDATPIREDSYVWIVEDDQLVREALHTLLCTLSIRHDFAATRGDLERLTAEHGWPGFAVLDDMLGHEETGLDLARWLEGNVPKERILLVTGNTEPVRLRTLEESGFKVLRKPVSSDDLTAWLRSAPD